MSAGTMRRPGPRTTSECARVAARAQTINIYITLNIYIYIYILYIYN